MKIQGGHGSHASRYRAHA